MIKTYPLRLAWLGLLAVAPQTASAGSAVAISSDNHMVVAYGGTAKKEERRALDEARRRYGSDVRIFGATDIVGYGAIAKARHPNGYGWIVAAALGKRSVTEADTLAIKHCVQAGGKNPKIILAFHG
jgi:hypothetical protein